MLEECEREGTLLRTLASATTRRTTVRLRKHVAVAQHVHIPAICKCLHAVGVDEVWETSGAQSLESTAQAPPSKSHPARAPGTETNKILRQRLFCECVPLRIGFPVLETKVRIFQPSESLRRC